ncbi:MAG: DMT family transporter [Halanaerobiaceae bacterium]
MKKYLPYVAGIIFSSIFGFSFMFTKETLVLMGPFHLLAFRFSFAAIFLSIIYIFGFIRINYRGKKMGLLILLAVIQPGLYFIFETFGISLTTSSEAGIIIALIPVVVSILAALFLNERPGLKQSLFILLSVSGVLFIILQKDAAESTSSLSGVVLLLGAVLMAGIYNILSRKLSLDFKPVEITFIMMWTGAVFFNLIAYVRHDGVFISYFSPLTNIKIIISIFYLGLLSSVLAFFLMNYTLSRIEAAQSAVFANLTTIVSILAGVFIRGENFYWYQLFGGIMIIIGVWGTNYFGKVKIKVEKLPS